MKADMIMLRAQRMAILGEFLATMEHRDERLEFLVALKRGRAISDQAIDILAEAYIKAAEV